jgi:acyl-CoA thioesterase-1
MTPVVVTEDPDLVVVAFGMNDASGRVPTAKYADAMLTIITTIRASKPETGIILVATMYGNPEWSKSDASLYGAYRDALASMADANTTLADMTSLTGDMLSTKKFTDITANGLNHPNDFLHRVYAQLILELFPYN